MSTSPDARDLGVASTLAAIGQARSPRPAAPGVDGPDEVARGLVRTGNDRYEVVGRIGEGGMGAVDHVWDCDLMRDLAVKQLRRELGDDELFTRQFLWEARVTAYLDHPHVVPVHDVGIADDGRLFFTMKLVRGESLATIIERLRSGDEVTTRRFGPQRRLRLFHTLTQVVAFAHARGVLHRDLKPGNVMVGEHGELLVVDWGLAMPLSTPEGDALEDVRPDGVVENTSSGTPLYMSPEQARGDELDARSDLYTLGVILYELMVLAVPYAAGTVTEVLEKVSLGKWLPARVFAPDLAPSVVAVLERAMAPNPDDRYLDATALAEDVERVIDGRTPEAEDAGLLERAARFYTSPKSPLGRLRMIDFEMLMGSASLAGAAVGLWFGARLVSLAWPMLGVAGLLCVPPLVYWRRALRDGPPSID